MFEADAALADSVAEIDDRFNRAWPMSDVEMLDHLRREVDEIEQAIVDAERRPDLWAEVIGEIGDAMLLLGRLALRCGAARATLPLTVVIAKTNARLAVFENLLPHMSRRAAWRNAKDAVRARVTR